jgi:hypothetical protein
MSNTHRKTTWLTKIALAIALAFISGLAGYGVIAVAVRVSFLGWIVNGPGWLVSRVFPINFHEGEGAFGFFLTLFLSWMLASIAAGLFILFIGRAMGKFRSHTE